MLCTLYTLQTTLRVFSKALAQECIDFKIEELVEYIQVYTDEIICNYSIKYNLLLPLSLIIPSPNVFSGFFSDLAEQTMDISFQSQTPTRQLIKIFRAFYLFFRDPIVSFILNDLIGLILTNFAKFLVYLLSTAPVKFLVCLVSTAPVNYRRVWVIFSKNRIQLLYQLAYSSHTFS